MEKLNMKENRAGGALITFCGLDGCGKTTMIKRLKEELSGKYEVALTKQPTDAVRGSHIFRTYTDSPDHSAYDYRSLSLLAASDRIQHTNKVILPMLEAGKIVISDRYYYSCLANLRARGYTDDRWIYEISESVIHPDAAIFIDVPVDTAIERVRSRPDERGRYIDRDLEEALRVEYINICLKNGGILVRGDISPDETYKTVKSNVMKILEEKLNEYK